MVLHDTRGRRTSRLFHASNCRNTAVVWVCVLRTKQISRLFYTQHNRRPCRCLRVRGADALSWTDKLCGHKPNHSIVFGRRRLKRTGQSSGKFPYENHSRFHGSRDTLLFPCKYRSHGSTQPVPEEIVNSHCHPNRSRGDPAFWFPIPTQTIPAQIFVFL